MHIYVSSQEISPWRVKSLWTDLWELLNKLEATCKYCGYIRVPVNLSTGIWSATVQCVIVQNSWIYTFQSNEQVIYLLGWGHCWWSWTQLPVESESRGRCGHKPCVWSFHERTEEAGLHDALGGCWAHLECQHHWKLPRRFQHCNHKKIHWHHVTHLGFVSHICITKKWWFP